MPDRIPLHGRNGSIVAHVTVDPADFDWLNQWHWRLSTNGYAERFTRKGGRSAPLRRLLMHREILGLVHGDGLNGDHRNRNRLDNRRSNLRIVPGAGNAQNVTSQSSSTSRFRGVHWNGARQQWYAKVFTGGRLHWLGAFDDEDAAGAAASAFRAEHMPFAVEH
jgi:IS5 family transposase